MLYNSGDQISCLVHAGYTHHLHISVPSISEGGLRLLSFTQITACFDVFTGNKTYIPITRPGMIYIIIETNSIPNKRKNISDVALNIFETIPLLLL